MIAVIKYSVAEDCLCSHTIDKPGFNESRVTIYKWFFIIAVDFYYRNQNPLSIKVEVTNPEFVAEILPPILKIPDVLSMPDNSHRINITEPDPDQCLCH